MKIAQFENMAINHDIAKIVLRKIPLNYWELWAYDHENASVVSKFGNRLRINEEDLKLFESIDEAYHWIRDRKYNLEIIVEG